MCEDELRAETGKNNALGEKDVGFGLRTGFPSVGVLLAQA